MSVTEILASGKTQLDLFDTQFDLFDDTDFCQGCGVISINEGETHCGACASENASVCS